MNPYASVRERVPPATAGLALGDVIVVVAVVVAGVVSHGENPLRQPVDVLSVVVPFVVGWLLVAGLVGVYHDPAGWSWHSFGRVAGAWIGGANVGLVLRQSPALPGGITWPFPLVITGFVLLALLGWRILATVAIDRTDVVE